MDKQKKIIEQLQKKEKEEVEREIANQKSYIFYPTQPFKANWDLLITLVLVFTCLVTPFIVAFVQTDDTPSEYKFHIMASDAKVWTVINYAVDIAFLIDMFIMFFSAYQDDDMKLIDHPKLIAKNYLGGWFIIDLIAIFPFEIILSSAGGAN